MEPIEKGTQIEVTDALGRRFVKRALAGINRDGDFESVWACSEEEWSAAQAGGRDPEPELFPWPVRSIRILEIA